MVTSEKKYMIEEVKQINIRYYLIRIDGKSYVLDFSNPRDLRNYFAVYFPNVNRQWSIYDVTGNEESYKAKKLRLYKQPEYEWLGGLIFILCLLSMTICPEFLNIRYLTQDEIIAEYWKLVLGIIFMGAVGIFMCLAGKRTDVGLSEKTKNQCLVREYSLPMKTRILSYIGGPLISGCGLFVGISASTYADVLLFAVFPLYSIIFMKFGTFLDPKITYQITDK